MAADTKTPLQAIVSVVCDTLHDLSPDDQARTLEAVRVTLGLRAPVTAPSRDPYPALPMVEVEMMGNGPMVVSPPANRPGQTGRSLVIINPDRRTNLRQLPRPPDPADGEEIVTRGYVRSIR